MLKPLKPLYNFITIKSSRKYGYFINNKKYGVNYTFLELSLQFS